MNLKKCIIFLLAVVIFLCVSYWVYQTPQSGVEKPENSQNNVVKIEKDLKTTEATTTIGVDKEDIKINPAVISEDNFGPITKKTLFDIEVIRKLFPNYIAEYRRYNCIEGYEECNPGIDLTRIYLSQNGKDILTITTDEDSNFQGTQAKSIITVETESSTLPTENGDKVGDSFEKIYRGITTPECHLLGGKDSAYTILCSPSVTSKKVLYFFDNATWPSYSELNEQFGIPERKFLNTFKLKSIMWYPRIDYWDN